MGRVNELEYDSWKAEEQDHRALSRKRDTATRLDEQCKRLWDKAPAPPLAWARLTPQWQFYVLRTWRLMASNPELSLSDAWDQNPTSYDRLPEDWQNKLTLLSNSLTASPMEEPVL